MSVKTVQCCQCGSPLTCPEAGDRFIQCQHCSALLEIQDLERGSITRLHSALLEVQEKTAEQERQIERLQAEQELSRLDREWRERWKAEADSDDVKMCFSSLMATGMFVVAAFVVLVGCWVKRAPFTPNETQLLAKSFASTFGTFSTRQPKRQSPLIPWRADVPARIGGTFASLVLITVAYLFQRHYRLFSKEFEEYQRSKASLLARLAPK